MSRLTSLVRLTVFFAVLVPGSVLAQNADGRLGTLSFPNSGSAAAQEPFLRGVLLLHSFEYPDAAEAFREAQHVDSDFVMAYWGEAMTYNHPLWFQHDRDAAVEALARLAPTRAARLAKAGTERERMFLEAVETLYGEGDLYERNRAYRDAMRRMYERYPQDDEVAAFYALSILGTSEDGRDPATYMKAAAVADEVFRRNPDHPGAAHYLIHSFDDPIHAPLGLRAARAYSEIAPGASHALHMPSHIFVALGMWEEVAELNVRSWDASVARASKKGLSSTAYSYHAILWDMYARTQMGEMDKAADLVRTVQSNLLADGGRSTRYYLARMIATYTVESGDYTFALADTTIDSASLPFDIGAMLDFSRAWASLETGDQARAESILGEIKARRAEEAAAEDDVSAAEMGQYRMGLTVGLVLEMELEALLLAANGDTSGAISKLEQARDIEYAMPFEYGPPYIVKPSAELLGEMLAKAGRTDEAVEAFKLTLDRMPGRHLAIEGLESAGK